MILVMPARRKEVTLVDKRRRMNAETRKFLEDFKFTFFIPDLFELFGLKSLEAIHKVWTPEMPDKIEKWVHLVSSAKRAGKILRKPINRDHYLGSVEAKETFYFDEGDRELFKLLKNAIDEHLRAEPAVVEQRSVIVESPQIM